MQTAYLPTYEKRAFLFSFLIHSALFGSYILYKYHNPIEVTAQSQVISMSLSHFDLPKQPITQEPIKPIEPPKPVEKIEPKPIEKIKQLNVLIEAYCLAEKIKFVEYYAPMVDENFGLDKKFTDDGVHPNLNGYLKMKTILESYLKL